MSGASIGVISLVARIERKRNPGIFPRFATAQRGLQGLMRDTSKLVQQATVTADSVMDAGKPKHIPGDGHYQAIAKRLVEHLKRSGVEKVVRRTYGTHSFPSPKKP